MNRKTLVASLFVLSLSPLALEGKDSVWTDPAKATAESPDFLIQGEYTGKLGDAKVGVQLVAEGAGKFAVVYYPGGLPGDGFSGDKATRIKGTADAEKVTLPDMSATLKDGKMVFKNGSLSKVERKSPTLGAAAPKGAVVLFDGKNGDAFDKGVLDGDTLCQGINSKQKFQSFQLHVEFKIPFMPEARGQGRGNSGCYLQSRYECQMLDSFGLEGETDECGGFYKIKTPDFNMAYPPLAWQTYDIDFTAATFDASGKKTANATAVVKHNGVLIHKGIELPHATTASPLGEGPEPGPLHLQDHGNPVRYRNIWIVEKK
jgi:hypothetical protein